MFLTETSRLSPFSAFRAAGKRTPAKNLDLISQWFDDNLLRRLKPLVYNPSIDLSWLSLAVDLLSATHSDAETMISDLKSSSDAADDSLISYVDDSVKVLDVCNFITSEIQRLRNSRLLINFVIHLLDFSAGAPSPEKLRRARKSLLEWSNSGPITKQIKLSLPDASVMLRELSLKLGNPPRGKITTVRKLVERTIYSVGALTIFVTGVLVTLLTGSFSPIEIRVPNDFLWADSFNVLESAVGKEIRRKMSSGERKRLIGELGEMDARVKSICNVIDDVDGDLKNAVKELATVTETFTDGLDGLSNGVNGFFHTVLCARSSLLQNFKVGPGTGRTK